MEIRIHQINDIQVAEIVSDDIVINSAEDGLNLLGNLYYQKIDRVILHEKNITPDFFELETGIAGEILQKFSNYRVRLAIVGDFTAYKRKSINDFIYESNKFGQTNFVQSVQSAISKLST
jgi:hypothetical protein